MFAENGHLDAGCVVYYNDETQIIAIIPADGQGSFPWPGNFDDSPLGRNWLSGGKEVEKDFFAFVELVAAVMGLIPVAVADSNRLAYRLDAPSDARQ